VQRRQGPVHKATEGVQLRWFADEELRRVVAFKPFHAAFKSNANATRKKADSFRSGRAGR
jgi:hypothetical protein